jgi:hypothetical protein
MQETFDELPDLLGKIKGKPEGLRTPDQYFEQFNDRMMDRLNTEGEMANRLSRPSWRIWVNMKSISAAAAIAALVAAGWWWWQPQPMIAEAPITQVESVELTADVAAAYIQANIDDFDEELLLAMVEIEEQIPADRTEPQPKPQKKPSAKTDSDELDLLLDDLTEEELEEML